VVLDGILITAGRALFSGRHRTNGLSPQGFQPVVELGVVPDLCLGRGQADGQREDEGDQGDSEQQRQQEGIAAGPGHAGHAGHAAGVDAHRCHARVVHAAHRGAHD
jgi:hypothetical protein